MKPCKGMLVILNQADELLLSEGIQAAMIFASFGEAVDLVYQTQCGGLINQAGSHIAKLIQSLEFYDIETPTELGTNINTLNLKQYQRVLSF